MKKQSLFGRELRYKSVTSCIIQLQPTQLGRKGLVCVILSSPWTHTLFKTCTTRISALFGLPNSYHPLVAVLCPALPDTLAAQHSVRSLFQSLSSLSTFLLLPFPLPKQRQDLLLLWFYLKSPEERLQRLGVKIQRQILVDHWENSVVSREQFSCPCNSPQYWRALFLATGISHQQVQHRLLPSSWDLCVYTGQSMSCTVPCITAIQSMCLVQTHATMLFSTDRVQGSQWHLRVMGRPFTSHRHLMPFHDCQNKGKPTKTKTPPQPFVSLQQHNCSLPS